MVAQTSIQEYQTSYPFGREAVGDDKIVKIWLLPKPKGTPTG
jgi:hypothetical protein